MQPGQILENSNIYVSETYIKMWRDEDPHHKFCRINKTSLIPTIRLTDINQQ